MQSTFVAVDEGLHRGHHGAVHFDNKGLPWCNCFGQSQRQTPAALVNRLGVLVRDPANGAVAEHNAVVLDQLVHGLGVWHVGPKVGHGALQTT